LRGRLALNATFLDTYLEAATAIYYKLRYRLARQNADFEGGLVYNFASGPLRLCEPNGIILS
jgi:hypothetical protein